MSTVKDSTNSYGGIDGIIAIEIPVYESHFFECPSPSADSLGVARQPCAHHHLQVLESLFVYKDNWLTRLFVQVDLELVVGVSY